MHETSDLFVQICNQEGTHEGDNFLGTVQIMPLLEHKGKNAVNSLLPI